MDHSHHEHYSGSEHSSHGAMDLKPMGKSATLHCLTGCAIGEITGMVIGLSIGLSMWGTVGLSIALAFLFGYILSMVPLLRGGVSLRRAFGVVLAADTLSILSMELAENGFMVLVPGAMESGLDSPLFWLTMAGALLIGFAVAYPVNLWLLRKGKGHALSHDALGHHEMDNRPLTYGLVAFLLGAFLVALLGPLGH